MKSADLIKNLIINELFWAYKTNLKRVTVIVLKNSLVQSRRPTRKSTSDTCLPKARSPNPSRTSRTSPRTFTSWTRTARPIPFPSHSWSSKPFQLTKTVSSLTLDTSSSMVSLLISLMLSTRTIKATNAAILRKTQGAKMTLSTRNKIATAYSSSANPKWIQP